MPASAMGTTEIGPYRVCAECHRAKSVRGVWYLVPARDSLFVCENCFALARAAPA